ncbi:Ycf66 family protein [Parasynechococcus sp.]|uniref:Ycf66 family protein n=1 Tax=Parasynechococcus sp. TaxID=3101203 RepID=UPI0037040102
MVNASLNWASIVGIVLAVGGALLYFMRSFKPALARDYDVFFAAIGLLCGGILFFQGWRLDPILQFGQFLLAGTTVFFAYESVRLRGVATEQARRSAYFDDEPAPARPAGPGGLRGGWDDGGYDRFDEPQPVLRRFSGRDDDAEDRPEEEFYRPRRASRAAIPEEAASRRSADRDQGGSGWEQNDERSHRMARFRAGEARDEPRPDFGSRRTDREEQRRGSRPVGRPERPPGAPAPSGAEDAAFTPSRSATPNRGRPSTDASAASDSRRSAETPLASNRSSSNRQPPRSSRPSSGRPRDNSSRFDD